VGGEMSIMSIQDIDVNFIEPWWRYENGIFIGLAP
jgi:hypothetical protein